MKVYQVLAPPTVLFFDQTGKWLNQQTMVGGQSAEEFLQGVPQAASLWKIIVIIPQKKALSSRGLTAGSKGLRSEAQNTYRINF